MVSHHIVDQLDARPLAQGAGYAAAQAAIRQYLRGMLGQGWVAPVGATLADRLNAQAIRQMAGTGDFHPVGKHQNADRGAGEIVAVDQRIDQQLLQRHFGNLQLAQRVEAPATLHVVQVATDKGEAALELLQQRAADVLAVQVTAVSQASAGEGHGLDLKGRTPALRLPPKQ